MVIGGDIPKKVLNRDGPENYNDVMDDAVTEESREYLRGKVVSWVKIMNLGIAVMTSGVAVMGADMYRAYNVKVPQSCQEYVNARENLSRLEADKEILSTQLTSNYPITMSADIFSYNNLRTNLLEQNELLRKKTGKKLSKLENNNVALTQYKSDKQNSELFFAGAGLSILGLVGFGVAGIGSGIYEHRLSSLNKKSA
ncbi:MAG: hypothetical protein OEL87_02070 [Nanoarchaeota archaeon]|nr:hypothetical protein [Nanoarchaeota archaeon]